MPLNPNIKVIGRREYVSFPELGLAKIEAKIDTGAYSCAIHCQYISLGMHNEKEMLMVKFLNNKLHYFENFTKKRIRNSFGEMEERFIIKALITIGRKKIRTSISLSDRGSMRYPVLIGRKLLKGKFMVDVNQIYTNGIRLHKLLNTEK